MVLLCVDNFKVHKCCICGCVQGSSVQDGFVQLVGEEVFPCSDTKCRARATNLASCSQVNVGVPVVGTLNWSSEFLFVGLHGIEEKGVLGPVGNRSGSSIGMAVQEASCPC